MEFFRFLRQRRKYLVKSQLPKGEHEIAQQHDSDVNERNYNVNEAVLKRRSPMPDMKPISVITL
jgi:hypothetical protein